MAESKEQMPSSSLTEVISPMTPTQENILAGKLCDWLKDTETFTKNVICGMTTIPTVPGSTVIQLVDGTRNGASQQAAIIRFRHQAHASRERIFLVVRGSGMAAREAWLMKNDAEPVPMSQILTGTRIDTATPILVHKRVLRAYRSIESEFRKIVRDCPAKSTVLVAGYGMGGAVARIAAMDLATRNRSDPYHTNLPIRVITFGAPQWFANKSFHTALQSFISGDTSYAGAWDPIPRLLSAHKTYVRSSVPTIWVHDNDSSESSTRETISVSPPSRMVYGCWPLCCGCGPREDSYDHSIQYILAHLKQLRDICIL